MKSSGSDPSPLGRFARNVNRGAVLHSRRDLLRTGAVLASASGLGLVEGVTRAAEQAPVRLFLIQDDIETGVELVMPFDPFGLPVTLHPHRAPNWGPFWVLLPHAWAGLLAFNELGGVVTDLAESVVPNDTADVWTATLRPDLVFASGNPITAQTFVDSWRRALDPRLPAPMTSFMELVAGFDAYVSGESDELGFAVVDESTIEITLSEPFTSFPASLATFVWAAIDLEVADDPEVGDPALAAASAGLWRFTELVDGDRIVMEPNEQAADPASPSIARVIWQILDGAQEAASPLDAYQNGAVAAIDVPTSLLSSVESDEALAADLVTIESQASTMAIGMDFNQAPFGDIRVRQAVAAAIDREMWATGIQGGEFVAATGLVPPVVQLTSGYVPAELIAFNSEQAASLLADAGIDPEADMAEVVSYQPATDAPDEIERHAALLAMIAENSGLTIRHDTTLTAEQIAALQGDNGGRQFDLIWWWTVTDTAALLQTIGAPDSPSMTGWFNWSPDLEGVDGQTPGELATEFAEHIAAANGSTDPEARNEAFRQAEQILLDNAVYIPLGHWVQRYLQKPWLQGTRQGPWSGRIPVRFDADVVVRGRQES